MPDAIRIAPGTSRGSRTPVRGIGFVRSSTPRIASGANTTLIMNAQRHENSVVRNPPNSGPKATAAPMVALHIPNAVPRSRPWNVRVRMAREAGAMNAAPMPSMIASPTTSMGTPVDSAAMSDPIAKSVAPVMNIRRGPWMSVSRPPMMSSAAKVRLYPVITHCSCERVVSKSRRIVGIATFRTELSSPTMNTPVRTTARVIQRRGSTASAAGGAAVWGVGVESVGFPPGEISV